MFDEAKYKAELEKWMKEHPGKTPPQVTAFKKKVQKAIDETPKEKRTIVCQDCGTSYIARTAMQFLECKKCGAIQH